MTDATALEATLNRLEDQLSWYDKKSRDNQALQKWSNILQIIFAAFIPLASWLTPPWFPALLGTFVAIFKGVQSSYQWEYNWINYRATAEKLKHEKFLFEAKAGPYSDALHPQKLLAERVEGTVSREHASWITLREERAKQGKTESTGD